MEEILFNNKKGLKKKKFSLTPPQFLVLGFLIVILAGSVMLTTSKATVDGMGLNFLDALFTSTSAVCVTGLVVVDTGTHLSLFGQIIIMILIQIGGLGFMTVATMMAIILGKKITLKERLLLQEALNQNSIQGVVKLVRQIIFMTFFIEFLGALLLALKFRNLMNWKQALFYGFFHSISAFNNAGFDLMGNFSSLTNFKGDLIVNLVVSSLFIIGGLGFIVIVDLIQNKFSFKRLSMHSKVVISVTFILLLSGFLFILIMENSNDLTIGQKDLKTKLLVSFFQGATPRTAGFNTIDLPSLRMATKFFMVFLMFIGASPSSTGGGIKTTSFVTCLLAIINIVRGRDHNSIFARSIPDDLIKKAFAILSISVFLVLFTTMVLTITESFGFFTLLFEATSAFGTVGLSLGITSQLSKIGKIMIIITMFAGRLGPLTLAFALGRKKRDVKYEYPKGNLMIG